MADGTNTVAQSRGSLVVAGPGAGKAMIWRRLEALRLADEPAAAPMPVVEDLSAVEVPRDLAAAAR